mgnify:CR=1 FL=1
MVLLLFLWFAHNIFLLQIQKQVRMYREASKMWMLQMNQLPGHSSWQIFAQAKQVSNLLGIKIVACYLWIRNYVLLENPGWWNHISPPHGWLIKNMSFTCWGLLKLGFTRYRLQTGMTKADSVPKTQPQIPWTGEWIRAGVACRGLVRKGTVWQAPSEVLVSAEVISPKWSLFSGHISEGNILRKETENHPRANLTPGSSLTPLCPLSGPSMMLIG